MDKYDSLKIENQICFPLYAWSKEIIRMYKPFIDELDLTYTQYITMMILWDKGSLNVKVSPVPTKQFTRFQYFVATSPP